MRTLYLILLFMYRMLLSLLFLFFTFSVSAQRMVDTFHLYFDLNIAALNKNTEKKIDLLIYNDKIINGSSIMVVGYTDFLGTDQYNKNLSMQRAKNVKDYLTKYGINASDVKICVGKGEIKRTDTTDKDGNPIDRKVDIVVNNKFNYSEQSKHYKTVATNTKTPTVKTQNTTANSGGTKPGDMAQLTTLKAGQTILLKNVYFPLGSHMLKAESYETLERLYTTLRDNPNLKISIEGHVCCINGDIPDALDMDTNEPLLSVNRAKAILNYLVKKGIDDSRLQFAGFGKQHPIVPFERSEADAEKNRRVEIRIVSNQ